LAFGSFILGFFVHGGWVTEDDAAVSSLVDGRTEIPSSESVVDTDRFRFFDIRF
jgi:hypothetical protein